MLIIVNIIAIVVLYPFVVMGDGSVRSQDLGGGRRRKQVAGLAFGVVYIL